MPKRGSSALPDYAEREEIPLGVDGEVGPLEIALAGANVSDDARISELAEHLGPIR